MSLLEVIVSICLLLGTAVILLGSLGVVRFGDVFLRMHAWSKSTSLGIGFLLIGVTLYFSNMLVTTKLIALAVLYLFTSPVGAQVLAHNAHVSGVPMVKETWIDELADPHGAHEHDNHH